jgi:hypothetical protein
MKRHFEIKIITMICLIYLSISCTKFDNYDEPGETLMGQIIDKNTGKPLQTSAYDCMIKLEETSWSETPEPLRFTSKPDGTFLNTKVFRGTYTVTPVDGPFFPIEGKSVEIKGTTTLNFEVVPYLNVSIVNFTQSGTSATVEFKISSSTNTYKVTDAQVFVATTPFVSDGTSIIEYKKSFDFTSTANAAVYTGTRTARIDNLKSKRTYYIRVGARVDDPISKRYNYSEYKQVVIP